MDQLYSVQNKNARMCSIHVTSMQCSCDEKSVSAIHLTTSLGPMSQQTLTEKSVLSIVQLWQTIAIGLH